MAYETEELKEQALKAIEDHDLYFVSDVVACLPCSSSTFYGHELEKDDDISNALMNNSVSSKRNRSNKKHIYKGSGYVYVIRCVNTNYYKIGVSKADPQNRISNLQSGCPLELRFDSIYYCEHYSLLEREIHRRYSKYRHRGEWFNLTDQQLLCIKSDLSEQSNKQLRLF